jgi:type I restriction enzyme S subunit
MEFYKETQLESTNIGVFPKSWRISRIDDICRIRRGASPRPIQDKSYFADKGRGWIRIEDVTSTYKFLRKTSQYLSAKGEKKSVSVEPGDLIMSICATIGKPVILGIKACIHDGFVWFSELSKEIDTEYLFYILQKTEDEFVSKKQTGTQGNLNTSIVGRTAIPVPALEEQRKIAAFISRIDLLIQQTDSVIRKTQELKKGLMQHLLTKGIGHKEFKYSEELGCEIPKEWKIGAVSEICHKPEYGYTQSATDKQIGPKFLRITDIQDGKVEWDNVPFCLCPESFIDRYKLEVGDILFARTGATTGKSYIIGECPEAVFASYLIRIKTKEEIRPEYLYYFFNSKFYWDQVKKKIGGSAQGGMNASLLSEIKVHFPPKEEQKSIVTVLAHVDKKIDEEKQTKTRLEKMKKSLIQILLTGQVRIKVN